MNSNKTEPIELKEPNGMNRIINRHKARILQNLEEAGCPVIFRDAVCSGLNYLRSDINEHERNGATNERYEKPNGNR